METGECSDRRLGEWCRPGWACRALILGDRIWLNETCCPRAFHLPNRPILRSRLLVRYRIVLARICLFEFRCQFDECSNLQSTGAARGHTAAHAFLRRADVA